MSEDATTLTWSKVATLDDLWEGETLDVQVGDQLILLVHLTGGEIRAYQGDCPHQRTALADGHLDGHVLTCAAHLWQFDLSTGQGVNPQGCRLDCYQVKVEDETISVGIPQDRQSRDPLGPAPEEEASHGHRRGSKTRRPGDP
jgi:toluene monooxygenase system ferredoxin subunit